MKIIKTVFLITKSVQSIGPFNSVKWKFQGEEVNVRAMVKHYLMEFIKNSAR